MAVSVAGVLPLQSCLFDKSEQDLQQGGEGAPLGRAGLCSALQPREQRLVGHGGQREREDQHAAGCW